MELTKFVHKIIQGTIEVYHNMMEEMLPTPLKSHYLFNLRDFAKVIFGICMSDKEKVQQNDSLVRLWAHEVWRVFGDRLINDEDKNHLLQLLRKVVGKSFNQNFDTIFAHLDYEDPVRGKDTKVDTLDEFGSLIWSDVLTPMGQTKRYYEEITEFERI